MMLKAKRLLTVGITVATTFLCCTVTVLPGAVGGPQSIEVKLGYKQNKIKTLTVEFEGGKEARILVTGDVRGYSVVYAPGHKSFYGRLEPTDKPGVYGIQGSWTPEKTSTFYIDVLNDDDEAKKDATFHITTN